MVNLVDRCHSPSLLGRQWDTDHVGVGTETRDHPAAITAAKDSRRVVKKVKWWHLSRNANDGEDLGLGTILAKIIPVVKTG